MNDVCKAYQLEEFRRRQRMKVLRQTLQASMPDKYKDIWWCKDEAVAEIRAQIVESTNHCVIDGFLGNAAFERVKEEVHCAKSEGILDIDGVLTFKGREESIRTDKLGWFDCTTQPNGAQCYFTESRADGSGDEPRENQEGVGADGWPHLQYLLQRIETVVSELGEAGTTEPSTTSDEAIRHTLSASKTRSKVMVTCYDGRDDDSSRYTPHVDNGNKNGRTITAIYYLNESWKHRHGGALKLYARTRTEDGSLIGPEYQLEGEQEGVDTQSVHTTVEPLADRLVLFLSDWRTPHEVLPTHRDRFAVTVWFYDPSEKKEANARAAAASSASNISEISESHADRSECDSDDESDSAVEAIKLEPVSTIFTATDPDDLD